MSLISNLKNFFGNSAKSISGNWRTIVGGSTTSTQQANAFSDWVYVAISVIAETVGSLEYFIQGANGEIKENHYLNKYLHDMEFMESIAYSILIFGNAFILKEGTMKKPILTFLEHNKVSIRTKNGNLIGYTYYTNKYTEDEIIHIKRTNVLNKHNGLSTIDKILDWISNAKNGSAIKNAFYRNGGTLTNILETEYETEDELEILRSSFENHHRGTRNSGKTLILPAGVKYVHTGKISDIHNSEESNADRDRILSAFRVPKHILGITETGSSKADAEAKNISFYQFAIVPIARIITSGLTKGLLLTGVNKIRSESIGFVDPTPQNRELKLKENSLALAGKPYKTLNEVREEEGLPPIKGGDVIEIGIGNEINAEPKKAKENKDPFDKLSENLKNLKKKVKGAKDKTQEEIDAEYKAFDERNLSGAEKMREAVLKQQEEMKERIKKTLKSKNKKELIEGAIEVDVDNEKEELRKIVFSIAEDLAGTEGAIAMESVSSRPYDNGKIKAKLEELVSINTDKYTETTINLLEKELSTALENGEDFRQIAKRVDDVFSLGGDYRALRIAQDTVFGASNIAIRDAYVQSGVVKTVVWYTAQDERVCTECGPMHGKEVGVEEIFYDKGDTIERSDGTTRVNEWRTIYSAPLHSNCRCYTHVGEIEV